MGCVSSALDETRRGSMSTQPFEDHIQKIQLSRYDDFFQTYYTPIAQVKSMRKEFSVKEEKFLSTTGAIGGLKSPTLTDGIKAYVLILSANHNGDFELIELAYVDRLPFITVNKTKLSLVDRRVHDSYEQYSSMLEEVESNINRIITDFKSKNERLHQLEISIDHIADGSNLTPQQKQEAKKKLLENMDLIRLTQKHASYILDKSRKKVKLLRKGKDKAFSDKILLKTKGMQAYEDNVYEPKLLVEQYWPYPNQTIK